MSHSATRLFFGFGNRRDPNSLSSCKTKLPSGRVTGGQEVQLNACVISIAKFSKVMF